MIYSYIKPQKKNIFTQEMQLLSTFFIITIAMLFLTYAFLLYKDYSYTKQKLEKQEEKTKIERSIETLKVKISKIEERQQFSEKIYTKNSVLKDSIRNLFDLIPARITLSKAELLKDGLILYGITPNKDTYNFMLYAPLHAIFHRTYSSFYPAQNGWLHFVSTNYIDDEEEFGDEK